MMYNSILQYVPHSEVAGLGYDDFFPEDILNEVNNVVRQTPINQESLPSNFIKMLQAVVGKINHENWQFDLAAAEDISLVSNQDRDWHMTYMSDPSFPNVATKLSCILLLNTSQTKVELDSRIEQEFLFKQGRLIVFPSFVKYRIISAPTDSALLINFVGPKFK